MSQSKICKFYENKNIFITGGNGFIGKILVEKLLRTTEVSCLYLLMRRKKGKDVNTRLEEMLDNEPFSKLRNQKIDYKNRIKVIVGDNSYPNLGLSVSDEEILFSKIDIVFHVAATIRFHEDITVAYDTNVVMTKKIIKLCKQMENLKSFIYVSTAYCNCYLKSIDEIFYDNFDFDYNNIEEILNQPYGPNKLTTKILKKWPNTYSFTKAIAELLIRNTTNNLPVGIFRPSIVISTYKEPIEGWTDSFGGPNALVATVASGFTRFFCCDINNVVDLVPVDMTVSALITTAWDVYENTKEWYNNKKVTPTTNIPIYNYVSSVDNPITYNEFIKLNIMVHNQNYPVKNCLWAPKMTIRKKSKFTKILFDTTYHYLPALLIDIASICLFKKPTMIAKYIKFNTSRYHMEYFMANEWNFTNYNIKKLWNKMNENDKKLFNFDLSTVNWLSYFKNYYKGIRLYLFKEPWSNLVDARIKLQRYKIAHQLLLFIFYFIGMSTLWVLVLKFLPLQYLKLH